MPESSICTKAGAIATPGETPIPFMIIMMKQCIRYLYMRQIRRSQIFDMSLFESM